MKQYVCSVCSYTYDEAKGIPEAGIAPGTKWEDLPSDWKCPWCGADKSSFNVKEDKTEEKTAVSNKPHVEKQLSAMEMSIICSNLSRGCRQQYMEKEAESFAKLAEFFRSKAEPVSETGEDSILELIEKDLSAGYPYANGEASVKPDRGALRALVWSEKVTRMLKSLLSRYRAEGEKMLENTGVWVCTVCGFTYIGDSAPEICPVCKVPSWKFEKVERRAL